MSHIVRHPLLSSRFVEARAYQLDAVAECLGQSTLLVLSTALGKTAIEWMVIAERLKRVGGRAVLLAPTNALVDQHLKMLGQSLNSSITDGKLVSITGSTSPNKRVKVLDGAEVIVATPQVIRNDVEAGRMTLEDVSVMIVDEAHHAKGNHAMAQVGDHYRSQANHPLVLGATASPGSTAAEILEVCERLNISNIHYRDDDDPLVIPYSVGMEIDEVRVDVPRALRELAGPIERWLKSLVDELRRLGHYTRSGIPTIGGLQAAQTSIQGTIAAGHGSGYRAAKTAGDAMRLMQVIGYLLSQGVAATRQYLERKARSASEGEKKSLRFVSDPRITDLIERLSDCPELHAKIPEVRRLVHEQLLEDPESRVIVFAHFRDTGTEIVAALSDLEEVKAARFVGQSDKEGDSGMSQAEQIELLERFRGGEINVLIATSVGEEGLDIPSADRVVFYEPIPSEIRTIQRRGRTGRHREGKVHVLIANDTKDEGARRAAISREERMKRSVRTAVSRLGKGPPSRDDLTGFMVVEGNEVIAPSDFITQQRKMLAAEAKVIIEEEAITKPPSSYGGQKQGLLPRNQTSLDSFQSTIDGGRNSLLSPSKDSETASPAQIVSKAGSQTDESSHLECSDEYTPSIGSIERNPQTKLDEEVFASVGSGAESTSLAYTIEEGGNTSRNDLVSVIVDHREMNSGIAAALRMHGIGVEMSTLQTGDFRIGDRVLIERKTVRDFVDSLLDGRLLEQTKRLVGAAPRTILLIEGGGLFTQRSVHINSILGAMTTITIDFGLPIISTADINETARLISIAARREEKLLEGLGDDSRRKLSLDLSKERGLQKKDADRLESRVFHTTLHQPDSPYSMVKEEESLLDAADSLAQCGAPPLLDAWGESQSEIEEEKPNAWQQPQMAKQLRSDAILFLSALPGVGQLGAERMLSYFGDLPSMLNASVDELRDVPGIGPAKAESISRLLHG